MNNNISKIKHLLPKLNAVDLFCGAGGLTKGLEKSGVSVSLGIDIDPTCEYPYSKNNKAHFLLKSIEEITKEDLPQNFRTAKYKLLAGCAPCQTFSKYNQKANSSDNRWWLLLEFSRLINETLPELITMENVPGLVQKNVFKEFINNLKQHDYHVVYQVVKCSEYGLPQNRKRLVLLASRLGKISLLDSKNFGRKKTTVRDAIGKLTPISAGGINNQDPLHQSASLSELNHKRILVSYPGGTWRDWPENLVADCHSKETGKTYPGVYGRMSWDQPAPTITTQFYGFGNGRFGHPEQHRAISLREGAILQSFPKNYKFVPPGEVAKRKVLGRLIGNAVPVKLGEIIGKSIIRHIAAFESNS